MAIPQKAGDEYEQICCISCAGQKKRENNSKAADSPSCWDSLKLILSVTAELAFTQREIQQK